MSNRTDEDKKQAFKFGPSKVRASQLKTIAEGFIEADSQDIRSDAFLQSFKGIGLYVSNSMQCGAFGELEPALDTNMIRVLQRVLSWKSTRRRPRDNKKFWEFSRTLVPKRCVVNTIGLFWN